MKKLIYLVVVLVLGAAGYYYYQSTQTPKIPEFIKAVVSQGEIVEEVIATGTLQAKRTVAIGSQVSGRVTNVYVDFNDIVRKGQVLATIDTALLDTQVQIQEANISRQEVDLANQRVQLADAKRTFERQEELFEKTLASQQAYEAAELSVKSHESQILSAEKSMVQAQFNLEQAKLNVGYATIFSSIDGVVVDRKVDPGMTVQSSQNVATLFTLAADLTVLKLEGGVDESEIGKVRTGMTVRFTVDAYPQQTFQGEITMVRLNPTIQSNVVTYTTVAEVRNSELKLKPGMTASMRIEVSRRDNVLRIPAAALRFRPNNDMYAALSREPSAASGREGRGDAGPNPFAGSARTGGDHVGGEWTGGGRGGNAQRQATATPLSQRGASSIDELFPAVVRNPTRGQVYILVPPDATQKYGALKRLDIMQGITNGAFTELVSGPPELTAGTDLVTNIVMPWLAARTPTITPPGNPFQQPGHSGVGGGGHGR